MSIINRMLQDLETRNANEHHDEGGVFHSLADLPSASETAASKVRL